MAREPHYPDDAHIGSGESAGDGARATAAAAADKPADPKRSKHLMAGAAIGIGSAAIVAALLYANRKGRSDKG